METPRKWFCLPLFMNLPDGVKSIFGWEHPAERQDSHVVQMIDQGFVAAQAFGKAILLLDRYFLLSIPALERWKEANASAAAPLHIVTKAKANAVAYEHPPTRKKGFEQRFTRGEDASALFTKLAMVALHHVRGIDELADFGRVLEEGRQSLQLSQISRAIRDRQEETDAI